MEDKKVDSVFFNNIQCNNNNKDNKYIQFKNRSFMNNPTKT